MIGLVLAGAGVGLGAWLLLLGIRARPSLVEVGNRLNAPGRTSTADGATARDAFEVRLAGRLAGLLRAAGLDPAARSADLRVCRRTVEQHVLAKLGWAVGLGALGLLLGLVLLPLAGPVVVPLLWVMGSALGFYLPEMLLSGQAGEARKAFRHAYGGYLDLVNVMLAAGAGPESALHAAADSGGGWAFAELRGVLESARRTRRSVADAFGDLGKELGVVELEEMAASIALVGRQGARVRSSLAAKADALRTQQLAEVEAEAEAATERMTLPVALLLFAFLLLLVFPAVVMIGQTGSG